MVEALNARIRPLRVAFDGADPWGNIKGNLFELKGINWTICQGEHWLLIGPNGSGKVCSFIKFL